MKAIRILNIPVRIEKNDGPFYDGNYVEELGEGIFLCPMRLAKSHLEFPGDFYLIENTPEGMIELEIPTQDMGWFLDLFSARAHPTQGQPGKVAPQPGYMPGIGVPLSAIRKQPPHWPP